MENIEKYISPKVLADFIGILYNARDKMYCQLLYEGLSPEEIVGLHPCDIENDNCIRIGNELVQVSDLAYKYIIATVKQQYHSVYNYLSDSYLKLELLPSEYIIRFVDPGTGEVVSDDLDQRHYRMQRKLYKTKRGNNCPQFTEKGLKFSGLVTVLKPFVEKYGTVEAAYEKEPEAVSRILQRWKILKWNACNIYRRYMGD